MPLLVPFAKDSQSFYDWPAIIAATALSGSIAGLGVAYSTLKVMGAAYPERHITGLAEIAFHKITGFHAFEAQVYQNWLNAEPLNATIVWGAAGATAATVSYIVFKSVFKKIDADKHIRGRQLRIGEEANREARRAQAKAIKAGGEGLEIHESITLSRAQEVRSFFFMGSQGGGKTQILWRLILAILKRNDKCIIFDLVKGDFTKSIGRSGNGAKPLLLSLWDARSPAWDIGADCTSLADASAFARGLIPEGGGEPIWVDGSRGILTAVIRKLQVEYGTNWGWKELVGVGYLPLSELKEVAAQYYPPALAAVADAESKTSQSLYINMHVAFEPVYRIALAWGDYPKSKYFSLVKWLYNDNSKVRTIILQGNQRDSGLSGAYIRAITEMLTGRIASLDFPESTTRRCWWILDECPVAGRLECLARLMSYGRSRGFPVVVVAQDIAQIQDIYSEVEYKKWMSMCGIKIFGQVVSSDSQDFVSRMVGMREVDRFTQGVSRNTNSEERNVNSNYVRDAQVQVIHPSELEELGLQERNGKKFIDGLVLGLGKNALKIRWPVYSTPDLRPSLVSNEIIGEQNRSEVDLSVTNTSPATPLNLNQDKQQSAEETISDVIEAQQLNEFLLTELPENPQIYAQEFIADVAQEVVKSEITDEIASALGIDSTILDVGSELLLTANEEGSKQPETITNISQTQPKKRKKAVRVYADER
ncbi:MAG: type IV secretion system DNA-binding domain-containing protein [Methylotenera sp.]